MQNNRVIYLLIGVLTALFILMFINAVVTDNSEVGRYQIGGYGFTILDTKTGIAKTFNQMIGPGETNKVMTFDYNTDSMQVTKLEKTEKK
jgi:hypothetical protein